MDFANSAVKLTTPDNRKWSAIPLWLILQHGLVLGAHIVTAFLFMTSEATIGNFIKIFFGLVAAQSNIVRGPKGTH